MKTPESRTSEAILPTRAEFRQWLANDRRRSAWLLGIACAAVLLLFVGMIVSAEVMNRAGVPAGSDERLLRLFVLFPIPLVVTIGGLYWVERRSQARCSSCLYSLWRGRDPYLAIVTGRCPRCAARLFADDEDGPACSAARPKPTKTARQVKRDLHEAATQFRPALPWMGAGVLIGLGGALAAEYVRRAYGDVLGEMWTPFVQPLLLAPGVIVGALGFVACERALRRNIVACPHCANGITSWARMTGNCSACGRPAVGEPFPGLQSRQDSAARDDRRNIAEFRHDAKARWSRLWIGCFIGGALALVWCSPLLVSLPERPRYVKQTGWELLAYVVTMFGMGVMQCLGVWWWHRRMARGLHCPQCDMELLQAHPLVISSQRCYHCGCQVLDAPRQPTP